MIIKTRRLAPTDTRGERIRATSGNRQLTLPWDYGVTDMHALAARQLAASILGIGAEVTLTSGRAANGFVYEALVADSWYFRAELRRLCDDRTPSDVRVKLTSEQGETRWLSLNAAQYRAVRRALTGED